MLENYQRPRFIPKVSGLNVLVCGSDIGKAWIIKPQHLNHIIREHSPFILSVILPTFYCYNYEIPQSCSVGIFSSLSYRYMAELCSAASMEVIFGHMFYLGQQNVSGSKCITSEQKWKESENSLAYFIFPFSVLIQSPLRPGPMKKGIPLLLLTQHVAWTRIELILLSLWDLRTLCYCSRTQTTLTDKTLQNLIQKKDIQ